MWKPADVVPEHKRRAVAVWGSLLLAFVGYTVWQVCKLRDEYDNPGTTLEIADEPYAFPQIKVCFAEGIGCDYRLDPNECIKSASTWVDHPCYSKDGAEVTQEQDDCLSIDLTSLNPASVELGCNEYFNTSAIVEVFWSSSFDPSSEAFYTEAVGLFLGSGDDPEYAMVPYARYTISSSSSTAEMTLLDTEVTFGKTTRDTISGDSTTSYPILTISTSEIKFPPRNYSSSTGYFDDDYTSDSTYTTDDSSNYTTDDGRSWKAHGSLYLTLTQGTYSVTDIKEINPLDIGNLLGNIGGFWELMLVAWGVCFIATRTEGSTHKGRDFTQLGKVITSRKRKLSRSRRSSTPTDGSDLDSSCEERPYWSTAETNRENEPCRDISAVPPMRGRLSPSDRSASFPKAPVIPYLPRRSSRPPICPV